MITITRILAFLWYVLPFNALYSYMRWLFNGYMFKPYPRAIHTIEWLKAAMKSFKWRPEKTDWVQHPAQTAKISTGDCDDAAMLWATLGKNGLEVGADYSQLKLIGMMGVIWENRHGHAITLFYHTGTHIIYIASNDILYASDYAWSMSKQYRGATLRAIARSITPSNTYPIFYYLRDRNSLVRVSHWEFM